MNDFVVADHQLALELPELERLALEPPTFVPVWPPRAGTAWVVYFPIDGERELAIHISDALAHMGAVHKLPGALWFLVPERAVQRGNMS